jgi:opacity protein-like surface antigen
MRKFAMIAASAAALGAAIAAPTVAQAQYYGSYVNQPRGYAPPPVYAPPPPAYYRPRVVVTPGYVTPRYESNAYTDYRHFGDPTTRDALATCAYC